MNDLTLAIIGHLVGDYILQNDWMAQNKKKSSWPCVVHCFLWTCSIMMFTGWGRHQGWWGWIIMAALFVPHFIQDRTQIIGWMMSREWYQPKFSQPPMAPWSLVVVDNVWHIVGIWAVWKFIV